MLAAVAAFLAAEASANLDAIHSDFEYPTDPDDDQGEGRIFFSSNGGVSLSNATVNFQSLLAALLLGILFFVTLGPSVFGLGGDSTSGYGYSRYGQQQQQYGYGGQEFHSRSDRVRGDAGIKSLGDYGRKQVSQSRGTSHTFRRGTFPSLLAAWPIMFWNWSQPLRDFHNLIECSRAITFKASHLACHPRKVIPHAEQAAVG